jgi:hypothetical protein
MENIIKNKTQLMEEIKHIHFACNQLCKQILGKYFQNSGNMGVFCHSDEEYKLIMKNKKIIIVLLLVLLIILVTNEINFQGLKRQLVSLLSVSKDAFHIYIGFLCYLISIKLLKINLLNWKVLLLGIIVSLSLEVKDLLDNITDFGRPLWFNSLHDIINTNVIPTVLFLMRRKNS